MQAVRFGGFRMITIKRATTTTIGMMTAGVELSVRAGEDDHENHEIHERHERHGSTKPHESPEVHHEGHDGREGRPDQSWRPDFRSGA